MKNETKDAYIISCILCIIFVISVFVSNLEYYISAGFFSMLVSCLILSLFACFLGIFVFTIGWIMMKILRYRGWMGWDYPEKGVK